MYQTVQGLVIRRTDYNETDILLTLLTKELGRITVKARGARRKNSPLAVSSQLLVLAEFTLFEYKEQYVVNEAHILELFQELRTDLQLLSLATYMAQVAEVISQEDAPDKRLQPMVLNCVYALARLGMPELKVKAVFELRCACFAGFMPDLSVCTGCGREDALLFDISEGCLLCRDCRPSSGSGIRLPLTPGMLSAMRYLCYCDDKRIFSFSLSEEGLRDLSNVTEAYLVSQLERGFSALDFYKSLLIT